MAFGRAPKGLVDGNGKLERETAASVLGNAKPMTKSRRRRYLWSWWGMTKLLSMTSSTSEHRSSELGGAGVSSCGEQKEREGGARQWVL